MTAIKDFSMQGLPFAVAAAVVERDRLQHIMLVREQADVLDADAVGNAHPACPELRLRARKRTVQRTTASALGHRAIWHRWCAPARHSRSTSRTPAPWWGRSE